MMTETETPTPTSTLPHRPIGMRRRIAAVSKKPRKSSYSDGHKLQRPMRHRTVFEGQDHWPKLNAEQRALVVQWESAIFKHAYAFERRYGLDEGEMVATAFGIACRAAYGFAPERGYKFSTYLFTALARSMTRTCSKLRESERLRRQVWIPEWGHPMVRGAGAAGEQQEAQPWWMRELLDDRERMVVRMRADGCTLKQCANVLGVSRERVRQIQDDVARRLVDCGVATVDGRLAAA